LIRNLYKIHTKNIDFCLVHCGPPGSAAGLAPAIIRAGHTAIKTKTVRFHTIVWNRTVGVTRIKIPWLIWGLLYALRENTVFIKLEHA
jgi:hypothetical protein